MREPLLLPLAALAAGILAARYTEFGLTELVCAQCALAALGIAGFLAGSRRTGIAGLLVALIFTGAFLVKLHQPGPAPVIDARPEETVVIEGCAVEPSRFDGDRTKLLVEFAPKARARVNVYYKPGDSPVHFPYGARLDITGRIRHPHNYQNPGAFDYVRFLARQDIYWSISVSSPRNITRLDGECGSAYGKALYQVRRAIGRRLDSFFPNGGQQDAMLKAVLVGETTGLKEEWKEVFRKTGTYHTLVISGLHLTVLAGFLHLLFRLLPIPPGSKLLLTVAAAWAYAIVTGCHVSVVRAASGLVLFLIAGWFYRRRRLLNILAAIAIVFLVVEPAQLFDASFHLSFLAVAMIGAIAVPVLDRHVEPYRRGLRSLSSTGRDLHLAPRVAQFRVELRLIAETFRLWTNIPERYVLLAFAACLRGLFYLVELTVVSAVIQVGLILPMAVYFHRVALTGLLANPIVVPLMSGAVLTGFIAVATGWAPAATLAGGLATAALRVAGGLARWEGEGRVPGPPVWLGAAFLALLVLAAAGFRRRDRWRYAGALAVLLGAALILQHPFPANIVPGEMELTMIDVGQGESLLVVFPDGQTAVVDGGGIPARGRRRKPELDLGEDVVSPYLWRRSIQHLNVLVSTHGHEDHIDGLSALLENFRPEQLWIAATASDPATRALADRARKLGCRVVRLSAENNFRYGGSLVAVLSPPEGAPALTEARNNASLVLRLTLGHRSFLLTGDIERSVEERITPSLERSDVLKVAHHGSRTSTAPAFVEHARPVIAMISAGFENQFHFPNRQVLTTLRKYGTETFSTDRDGLITVRTDGRRLAVNSWRWQARSASR